MTPKTEYAIGIDFGTTKTSVATIIGGSAGVEITLPTIVKIDGPIGEDGQLHVIAVGRNEFDAWHNFKLDMGESQARPERCGFSSAFKGRFPAPHHLAAICLAEVIRKLADKHPEWTVRTNNDEHQYIIKAATITVPARWNLAQRRATLFAARVAGIKEVNLVEEPVAAYLHVESRSPGLSHPKKPTHTLIFDFGGGTCDMVIVKREPGKLPIVVEREMVIAGGQAIDEKIDWFWEQDLIGCDPNFDFGNGDPPPHVVHRLLEEANRIKHSLNPNDWPNILENPLNERPSQSILPEPILHAPKSGAAQIVFRPPAITRDQFDGMIDDLWRRPEGISEKLEQLLSSETINGVPEKIDYLIMVGGSSYVRPIIQRLKKRLPHLNGCEHEPSRQTLFLYEPKKAIALGAARYQEGLNRGGQVIRPTAPFNTVLELDFDPSNSFLPYRVAMEWSFRRKDVKRIQTGERLYCILNHRNDTLPVGMLHPFRLVFPKPYQKDSVVFKLYQTLASEKDIEKGCPETDLVDEIRVSGIGFVTHLGFYYKFGIHGEIRRWIVPLPPISGHAPKMEMDLSCDPDDPDAIAEAYKICFGKRS